MCITIAAVSSDNTTKGVQFACQDPGNRGMFLPTHCKHIEHTSIGPLLPVGGTSVTKPDVLLCLVETADFRHSLFYVGI